MNGENWLRIGAILSALAVAIGAFGAHGFRGNLEKAVEAGERTLAEADRALEVYETGVRYHAIHGLAVVALGLFAMLAQRSDPSIQAVGWLFVAGIVLFSGSLYLLSLSGTRWLGAVTPFGGLAFIAGWVWLAWTCARSRS